MNFSGAAFESLARPWNNSNSSTMSDTDRSSQRVPGRQEMSVVDTAGLLMVALVLFTLLVAVRVWLCYRDSRDKGSAHTDREERWVSSQILDLECLSAYGTPRVLGHPSASSHANTAGSITAPHLNSDTWASEDRDSDEAWYRQWDCDRHSMSSSRTWLLDSVDLLDVIVEESETSSGHRSVSTISSRCFDHNGLSQYHHHGGQSKYHCHNDHGGQCQFYDHTSHCGQSQYHDNSGHSEQSGHSQYHGHSDPSGDESGSTSSSLFLSCSQEVCELIVENSNTGHTDMEHSDMDRIRGEHRGLDHSDVENSEANASSMDNSDHSDMIDSDAAYTSPATSDTSGEDYRTCSQHTQPGGPWPQGAPDHSHSSATSSDATSDCLDLSPVSFRSLSVPISESHGNACQPLSLCAHTTWGNNASQLQSPGAHTAMDNDTCQHLSPRFHTCGDHTC